MTVRMRTKSRRTLEAVLKEAARKGEAKIKNKDGKVFVIRPEQKKSPLDVQGLDLDVSTEEIVQFIQESRRMVN